jgi:glycine/D-amino acid oxidase-like deaminating enzyme
VRELRQRHGVVDEELSEKAVLREPLLATVPVKAALYMPTAVHLSGPPSLLRRTLFAAFKAEGGAFVAQNVEQVKEGTMLGWSAPDATDWRRPLETSQHVPHSPLQRKLASQVVHTDCGREFNFSWVALCAGAGSARLLVLPPLPQLQSTPHISIFDSKGNVSLYWLHCEEGDFGCDGVVSEGDGRRNAAAD